MLKPRAERDKTDVIEKITSTTTTSASWSAGDVVPKSGVSKGLIGHSWGNLVSQFREDKLLM